VFTGCNFGPSGICNLISSLKGKALEELHLADNDMGDEGAVALAEYFKDLTSFCALDVTSNLIRG
jgi:hypothetical protein